MNGTLKSFMEQLQALVNTTTERIIILGDQNIRAHMDRNNLTNIKLKLIYAWGMDGSSGHAQYNQKCCVEAFDDSNVLVYSMSPIELILENDVEDNKDTFWRNLTPQSYRFCRPISIQHAKETKDSVLSLKHEIEQQIIALQPYQFNIDDDTKTVNVEFHFLLTMIDGKTLSYITNVPSSCCQIYGAKPNQMSSMDAVETGFIVNTASLLYGVSPLHCWLRFFECLLHISYRL